MTIELSKHLTDVIASGVSAINVNVGPLTTISFDGAGGGAGGGDQILDSANGLGSFHVGDKITVMSTSALNDGTYTILSVAAGAVEVILTDSLTTETAVAAGATAVATARGFSLHEIFKYSTIHLFGGSRPASPEAAEGVATICKITDGSGAFVGGADANGLLFDPSTIVDGVIKKLASQTWSGVGITPGGTITWGRLYANPLDTGADAGEAFDRIDFDAGATGDLLISPTVVTGNTKTIDDFEISVPQS